MPEARWSNAREALVSALSGGDTLQPFTTTPIHGPKAGPAVASRPAPAPAPPVPVKLAALRNANPAATLAVEVPSSPASKTHSLRDASNPSKTSRLTPRPATPLLPLEAGPVPADLDSKSPPVPSEAQPEADSTITAGATDSIPAQDDTPLTVKLRVASRPAAPNPLESTPPLTAPAAPSAPVSKPRFPQEEIPLLPIPGIAALKRRTTPVPTASRPSRAPFSQSNTQPAFGRDKSPAPASPNLPNAQIPSAKTLPSGPTESTRLTRHPIAKSALPVGKIEPQEETLKSSPWENAGRFLGYAVIVAILGVIVNTLYQSYKEMHTASDPAEPKLAAPIAVDAPVKTTAISSPPSTPKPIDPTPSPTPAVSNTPQNTTPLPSPPPAPTDEFITAVNGLKVTGVLIGTPLRVIINGRRFETGDLVNEKLGVRLVGYEADSRSLVFEDRTKAKAKFRY